jgi:hypothetical protein
VGIDLLFEGSGLIALGMALHSRVTEGLGAPRPSGA